MEKEPKTAYLDLTSNAVVVEHLALTDKDVVREAQRWTTGERGPIVDDPEQLGDADLTAYVRQAMRVGALALSSTGQAHEAQALDRMIKEVGEKTIGATSKAAELTGSVVKEASEVVSKAAADAKKAISEADERSRKEFAAAVTTAKTDLNAEMRRIFGGDSPELLERLRPLLDKFATDLDGKVTRQTEELLEKAAKQFDPSDPSSPMAKHSAELTAQQEKLTSLLEKNHTELAGKVEELTTTLKVHEAKTALAKVTPIKGGSFEDQVHSIMLGIAAGLGDEYADTTTVVGNLPRCKKGDGVLTINGGPSRLVFEMTDSPRAGWGDYFDEAERNRAAAASLGIVRTPEQNGDQAIRVLGPRRVVIAFDPEQDEPELLRTAVMLLRTVAIAASARSGATEIATAEEKIGEAMAQLVRIDTIKKTAGSIHKGAEKIDSECSTLGTSIRRLLDQALVALAGVTSTPRGGADTEVIDGAA